MAISGILQVTATFKPAPNISLSIGPQFAFQTTKTQWVGAFADPLMTATFGNRYVFGHLDQKIVSAVIRMTWAFTPKLSLQAYLQPFIGVGKYSQFRGAGATARLRLQPLRRRRVDDQLRRWRLHGRSRRQRAGAGLLIRQSGLQLEVLRGTVVLRWEYLPGSLIYLRLDAEPRRLRQPRHPAARARPGLPFDRSRPEHFPPQSLLPLGHVRGQRLRVICCQFWLELRFGLKFALSLKT